MRILHTSDWHLGKRLGRFDRIDEHREVLDEVVGIADEHAVDLVLVSGDVFDRPSPPVDALRLGLRALVRLGARRPVVAVAGNHDSPELFETLAPLLRPMNVHLVGHLKRPREGGMLGPDVLGLPAVVACFPFLREGRVVDFLADAGTWYGQYADRVAGISRIYSEALHEAAGDDLVPLLIAHFMVSGVKIDRAAPRGERELHIGQAYAATEHAVPAGPQYVAMGHVHAPQRVPGAPVPADYAGSLLALDFGEAGETKRVVIVEAEPGSIATRRSVPIAGGRRLARAIGPWEELASRQDLDGKYLDLTVDTTAPEPALAELARQRFAFLVNVRERRLGARGTVRSERAGRAIDELFADYYRETENIEPPPELLDAFREVYDEAQHAAG